MSNGKTEGLGDKVHGLVDGKPACNARGDHVITTNNSKEITCLRAKCKALKAAADQGKEMSHKSFIASHEGPRTHWERDGKAACGTVVKFGGLTKDPKQVSCNRPQCSRVWRASLGKKDRDAKPAGSS